MAQSDVQSAIDSQRMHPAQWAAVIVTICLNALDGFDVLSISFASPGIARDWGIGLAALGWILSMELIGMAVGGITLGGVADRIGRRPTILGCLAAMAIGMLLASHAESVVPLLCFRLLTGLGIGGMLATINASAAEFSNDRWRPLTLALMVIGYPLGGVIGGLAVQPLQQSGEWRHIFTLGAAASALFIPIVWFLLPESIAFLERRRRPDALARINRTLARFGHPSIVTLAQRDERTAALSPAAILAPGMRSTTVLITIAYFTHITSFYFLMKWVPKIVADLNFADGSPALALTWTNVGCASGGAIFGLVAMRVGLLRVLIATLIASVAALVWFGRSAESFTALATAAAAAGFFTNGAIAGFYTLCARAYPAELRATGTGFTIGLGRGGAVLAPVIAGYLFEAKLPLPAVTTVMALGSLMGAGALLLLSRNRNFG